MCALHRLYNKPKCRTMTVTFRNTPPTTYPLFLIYCPCTGGRLRRSGVTTSDLATTGCVCATLGCACQVLHACQVWQGNLTWTLSNQMEHVQKFLCHIIICRLVPVIRGHFKPSQIPKMTAESSRKKKIIPNSVPTKTL